MRIAVIVALVFLPGARRLGASDNHACSAAREQALPICKVLADARTYDGKTITVEGIYRAVIHGSVLYGPDCSKTGVNVRQASDYKADKQALRTMRAVMKKDWSQPVGVVVRGTFRVATLEHCFGENCLQYEMEEHELLCATPVKGENSSASKGAKGSSQSKPSAR